MVTAEPRQKNLMPGGFTPLLYAARQGCLECAKALDRCRRRRRSHGSRRRHAALERALERALRHREVLARGRREREQVGFLGPHAALSRPSTSIRCRTAAGRIGRRSTIRRASQMIDILLAAGANPNAQLKLFPPYRSLRMDRGADAILDIGTTPLLRAARGADIAAIERLVARRRAARSAAARRHHAADGRPSARARARSTRAASSAPSSMRSRRPTRCSRRAPPSTNATRAAARRCITRPPRATRTSPSSSSSTAPISRRRMPMA